MNEHYTQSNNPYERERDLLRHELDEAHSLNRNLLRQLKKAQEAATEAQRAHTKMVGTLTETMRENTALTIERDLWKNRAERIGYHFDEQHSASVELPGLVGQISDEEANIIRKAMARLHHPDAGGDSERMKAWNAALDRIAKR